jgi:hypothetical protein
MKGIGSARVRLDSEAKYVSGQTMFDRSLTIQIPPKLGQQWAGEPLLQPGEWAGSKKFTTRATRFLGSDCYGFQTWPLLITFMWNSVRAHYDPPSWMRPRSDPHPSPQSRRVRGYQMSEQHAAAVYSHPLINFSDLYSVVRPGQAMCPPCDSNAHWTDFESAASADWARGAGSISVQRTRSVVGVRAGGDRGKWPNARSFSGWIVRGVRSGR